MSVNKVILIGNVGNKPDIRHVGDRPIASFSLATHERGRHNPDGTQMPDITEWHNIVMWDKAAEIAERYIETGTKLYIEGKLRTRVWQDRNAIKRDRTEIIVETFDILSRSTKQNPQEKKM